MLWNSYYLTLQVININGLSVYLSKYNTLKHNLKNHCLFISGLQEYIAFDLHHSQHTGNQWACNRQHSCYRGEVLKTVKWGKIYKELVLYRVREMYSNWQRDEGRYWKAITSKSLPIHDSNCFLTALSSHLITRISPETCLLLTCLMVLEMKVIWTLFYKKIILIEPI